MPSGKLKSQSELLHRFKAQTEKNLPSLETALRRAAWYGEPDEILGVLACGANINAVSSSKGQTALHVAVLQQKLANVLCLVNAGASRLIRDLDKNNPGDLAFSTGVAALKEVFFDPKDYLREKILIKLILGSLDPLDFLIARRVSGLWNECASQYMIEIIHDTNEKKSRSEKIEFLKQFNLLSNSLRFTTFRQMRIETVLDWNQLIVKDSASQGELFKQLAKKYIPETAPAFASLCTSIGLWLLSLRLIKNIQTEKASQLMPWISKNGITALTEKYLTYDYSINSGIVFVLLSDFGIEALKLKLITAEQAATIPGLSLLLSKLGLDAMKKNLFTAADLSLLSKANPNFPTSALLSEIGLWMLEHGHLTLAHFAKLTNAGRLVTPVFQQLMTENLISFKQIDLSDPIWPFINDNAQYLSTPWTLEALKSGLLTQNQLFSLGKAAAALLKKNGLIALRKGYVTLEQAPKINDLDNLLTDTGLLALARNLITPQQFLTVKNFGFLQYPGVLTALEEKLVTVEQLQIENMYSMWNRDILQVLFSPNGLIALREKLITVEQASQFYHSGSVSGNHSNLGNLLCTAGLQLLRMKLITPEEACKHPELSRLMGPNTVKALQLKIIESKDFLYMEKYSFWGRNNVGHFSEDMAKDLIDQYHKHQDLQQYTGECVAIQTFWRGYRSRQTLGLFKSIETSLPKAKIQDLPKLENIRQLVAQGKLIQAKLELANLQAAMTARVPAQGATNSTAQSPSTK